MTKAFSPAVNFKKHFQFKNLSRQRLPSFAYQIKVWYHIQTALMVKQLSH